MTEEEVINEESEAEKLEGFIPRVKDEIKLIGQRESYQDDVTSFTHWSIHQFTPQLTDRSIRHSVLSSAHGSNVRAVWFDAGMHGRRGGVVGRLCVGRFRWAEGRELSGQELEDLTRELAGFIRQVAQGSPSKLAVGENSNVVLTARKSGFPCRGLLIVDSPVSEEWRKKVQTVLAGLSATLPEDCEVDLVDLTELYDLYLLRLDTYDLPVPETVRLKIVGTPAAVVGVPGRAVTLQIPLSEIYNLVHDHQLSLFSKNLRVPISGSKYNRKIQEVLSDSSERQNFWFFNNGITAVCHAFEFKPPAPNLPNLVVANQLQIVNGCQTSMTVYNEGLRLLDQSQSIRPLEEATVLVRLIELPSEDILRAALAQRIARYTNSQTPITGRDLHATDPIQAKFREEMNRDWRIFFETKKQEWKRRTEQNKTLKQNFLWPHVVRNDDAAQYYLSVWLQRPAFAKSHKKEIFEDDVVYDQVFGLRSSSESLLAPVFLSYLMEAWRKKRGYVKRHRGEGSAHRFSKDKVFTHGDFYLLSLVGASLKATLGVTDVRDADVVELRRVAKNLRLVNDEFGGAFQGSLRKLVRAVDLGFDSALSILYDYCYGLCQTDPGLDIRTILVRDATWGRISEQFGAKLDKLLDVNRGLLTMEF